jgi:flagellar hook-length control protein FliK
MIPLIQDWHRIALKEVVNQAEQVYWGNFNEELVIAEEGLRKKESQKLSGQPHELLAQKALNPQFKAFPQQVEKPEIHEMQFVFQKQEAPVSVPGYAKSLVGQVLTPFLTQSEKQASLDDSAHTILKLAENQKLIQKQITLEENQFEAWMQEVVTAARYIQKGEMKHLAFRLRPKDLGDVDVFVSEESGDLAVHIFAETKQTQERLQKQLPELINKLESFYHQNLKVKILAKPQSLLYQKLTQIEEGE